MTKARARINPDMTAILAVYAETEPKRRECEARWVREMTSWRRGQYILKVREQRGNAAADALWADVTGEDHPSSVSA